MTSSEPRPTFRDLLTGGRFAYGVEVVSTRGLETAETPKGLASLARGLLENPPVGWISITDNPGGGPMLPPDWLAGLVADHRGQVVVHLTCKDLNRSGLESAAWRYASQGFQNILALTGDYPTGGFGGRAAAVFDLDSLGLISLLSAMNRGLQVPGRSGGLDTLPKTDFFIGCAVSPFKRHERELMPQYFKLLRKIRAGAQWVVPQLGYDMRKFHEVKLLLAAQGYGSAHHRQRVPLDPGHRQGLSQRQARRLRRDRRPFGTGREVRRGSRQGQEVLQRAGGEAVSRFQGPADLPPATWAESPSQRCLRRSSIWPKATARRIGGNFMREIQFAQPGEFFLFEHDATTGLSDAGRINPEYLRSLRKPVKSPQVTLWYRLSRKVHEWAFTRDQGLYGLMQRIFRRLDKKPGVVSSLAYGLEKASKQLGYGCQDCGDCSLPDCATSARWRDARRARETVPAAARAAVAANCSIKSASGRGSISG